MPDFPQPDPGATGMHGPSPILGPDGQPLRRVVPPSERKKLGEEIAAPQLIGVRSQWDQSVASGLSPEKLAAILKQSKRGDIRAFLELAEEMEERDAHYAAVLGVRKRALSGIVPSISPVSVKIADKKICAAVTEMIEEDVFPDLVEDLLDSLGKGFSVVEIVWVEKAGQWRPAGYVWRDPKFFTFDHISRSEVRLAEDGTIDGVALPPAKFIVHNPKLKSGTPIRGGVARLAAWCFLFKSFSLKDWAAFLDVYGLPLRLGKYHPAATESEKRALLNAVASIASDAAAIIPETMQVEFVEAKGFSDKPFETFARYLDEQISKAVIGQTMTSDKGASGGLAQARVHDEVRGDILQADARQLAKTLNRDLVDWFVRFNFGDGAIAPKVHFPIAQPADIQAVSSALGLLVPLGLKVSQNDVREKLGLPAPDLDAELLVPLAAAPRPEASASGAPKETELARMHARACTCGACVALNAAAVTKPDALDELDADGASDWEPQVGPTIDAIRKLAGECASLEEFQARLNELYAGLDTREMETALALSMLKARGLGDAKDVV